MPRWVIHAVVGLLAVYLPTALWLRASYVSDEPKGAIVIQLLPPFERDGNAAISRDWHLGAISSVSDREDVEGDTRSPVVIYEGSTMLGPAHTNYRDIRDRGMGRFSSWQHQGVVFSTSDGSDPNANGRHYWAVVPNQTSAQAP